MNENTPVSRYLDATGIPYRLFQHPGPVNSVEQAAAERGETPDQVVRSILFRLATDEFVMVLMAGPQQISWPALRRCLGTSRLTMATPEEVLQVTGYPIGAVSPFTIHAVPGQPLPLRTIVDESVFRQKEISLGSGVRGTAVILRSADLRRALGEVETGDFI